MGKLKGAAKDLPKGGAETKSIGEKQRDGGSIELQSV